MTIALGKFTKDENDLFDIMDDWSIRLISHLSDEQMQNILDTEHGGMNEMLVDAYRLFGDRRYLEAAYRYSHKTIALAKAAGEQGTVKGLDFSKNMLKVGEEKVKPYPQIELMHGNAMELPFEDNTFDYVTIGFGLRNVPDYMQVLREINRVLKPGGMAVCLETSQSEIPVYRQLFRFYFNYIMPLFGKLFAKSYKEYSWLQESANDFPGMKKLASMFGEAGFQKVTYKGYSGGAAAMHMGFKKEN